MHQHKGVGRSEPEIETVIVRAAAREIPGSKQVIASIWGVTPCFQVGGFYETVFHVSLSVARATYFPSFLVCR